MLITVCFLTLLAYLLGSLPGALLLSRATDLPDPRGFGSGNPGATNVLRTGHRAAAAGVLLFDLLKGMLPVWLAYSLGVQPFFLGLVGIAACLGHSYPVFFDFKGGKGVATALGTLLPMGLDLGAIVAVTWLVVTFISGYSSLGSVITALLLPLYVYFFEPQFTLPVAMLSCLILFRHQDNIARLRNGTELRIGGSKQKKEDDVLNRG